ncbi:YfcZ/YiiS family protein [Neisseria sp. CCUG12390]|uniref:YfcZ/YiiS family protein n=1 Tax=Neisseria sp. CCUG12390 TaxID=3392035 RepID=UPI003A103825
MDKSAKPFETEENGVGKCPDCSVEVGTVFDNSDCSVEIAQVYETEQLAREAEGYYTELARSVESEPCEITSDIGGVEEGFKLVMKFDFCCQSEKVIFQLKQR